MLTRREFIRRLALSGLALTAYGCGSSGNDPTSGFFSDPPPTEVELAIVGGGMSGLYAGWRVLSEARRGWNRLGPSPRVAIYEAASQVGGRLYSLPTQDLPHIPTEVGGMRILSSQPLVNNLVSQFAIPTTPFPSGGDDNLYFLRGQRFTTGYLESGGAIPYSVAPREQNLGPGDLLDLAISDLVPDALQLSRADWVELKKTLTYQGSRSLLRTGRPSSIGA